MVCLKGLIELEKSRAMIIDAGLLKYLWGEAVRAAAYIVNRCPTRVLKTKGKTPAELWFGSKPDMKKLKIFGCHAYLHIPDEKRTKLDPKSMKLIMIGYCTNGYRLWDIEKKSVVVGRNVIFDEMSSYKDMKQEILEIDYDIQETDIDMEINENKSDVTENPESSVEKNLKTDLERLEEEKSEMKDETNVRKRRNIKIPARFDDYEMNFVAALSTGCLPSEVPDTYEEAIRLNSGWKEAIDKELNSLKENETWELVSAKPDYKIIDSKWVFCEKIVNNTKVKKARLVARGYQQSDLNDEVYAPVAKMTTIRMLFTCGNRSSCDAVRCTVSIFIWDIKGTSLYVSTARFR